MNRLQRAWQQAGRKRLIPFITAGHPDPALTAIIMHQLVAAGADVIELGMPFSDPMADGPVIQQASEQAIAQGVGLSQVFDCLRAFRADDDETPVVLMGYMNPVECMGHGEFARRAAESGADAVLLVDCPPEESQSIGASLRAHGLDQIFLVAPTTTAQRREYIAKQASGFVYYVALKGVTGAAQGLSTTGMRAHIEALQALTDLPVVSGFGVKDAESAAQVAECADGVVIGSALVERLADCRTAAETEAAIQRFIGPIRKRLDSV